MKFLKKTDIVVGVLLGIQIMFWLFGLWLNGNDDSILTFTNCFTLIIYNLTYWRASHNLEDYESESNLKLMNRVNKFRIITAFFSCIFVVILLSNIIGYLKIDKQLILDLVAKIAFIYIAWMGNYMYNIKENGTLGVINSFTDNNEIIWKKATNLKSRILFYGGIICFIFVIVVPSKFLWLNGKPIFSVCLILVLLIMQFLIPHIYSKNLSKKIALTLNQQNEN
jgi:hypothetical protein